MAKSAFILSLTGAVSLAACLQDGEAPGDSGVAAKTVQSPIVEVGTATGGDADIADRQSDNSTVKQAVGRADTIPQRFRGVWDYVDGQCNPASDLRMEIGPREIEFYESIGTVTGVEVENANAVVVSLSMTGEGMEWDSRTRYTLSNDGAVMTPIDADGKQPGTPMARKRCPK